MWRREATEWCILMDSSQTTKELQLSLYGRLTQRRNTVDFILSYKPHATNANTPLTAQTHWTDMKGIRISPYQSVLKCIHTILFHMAGKNRWKPRSFVPTLSLSWRTVISGDDGSLHVETSLLSSASCSLSLQTHRNHQWTKQLIPRLSFSSEIMFVIKTTLKPPMLRLSNIFHCLSLWSAPWQRLTYACV